MRGFLLLAEELLGFQELLFHGVNLSPFKKKYSPAGVLSCPSVRLAVGFEGFSSRYACHNTLLQQTNPTSVPLCEYFVP